MRATMVLLLAVATSGCVTGLLYPPATSAREAACEFLRPMEFPLALVRLEMASDAPPLPLAALEAAVQAVRSGTDRTTADLRSELGTARAGPWTENALANWLDEERPRGGVTVLRILWVAGDGETTGRQVGPGAMLVDGTAVHAAAQRLAIPAEDVARGVLLHHMGHALGVVNRGIPVQSPRIQEREGPAGHEPDPASVLAAAWERPETIAWVDGATYDAYSAATVRDWRAARTGVCA